MKKIKEFWDKLSPFIKGGLVGIVFSLLLLSFDILFFYKIISDEFAPASLLVSFITIAKHFIIVGISWNYLTKIKSLSGRIISILIGAIVGVIAMLVIQAGLTPLLLTDKLGYTAMILGSIVYSIPAYFAAFLGLGIAIIPILITNALIGIAICTPIAFKILSKRK